MLMVNDMYPSKRTLADELGAGWCDSSRIRRVKADVLMPTGAGGTLASDEIDPLGAGAVLGPSKCRLADADSAARLAARGVLYAPDHVINGGASSTSVTRARPSRRECSSMSSAGSSTRSSTSEPA